MLFTTATQFAVLALCLVAGWIFGLASASGGRRWRDKHRAEEAAHLAYRKDAEARLTAAETRATTAEARVRELEAAHERARQVTAVPGQHTPGVAGAGLGGAGLAGAGLAGARVAATTRRPVATDAASPAGSGWRGWFGGSRDDLTLIRGVDEPRARGLTDLGVRSYADIERMDADDEREVEVRLGLPAGTIASEQWREQAALLARGDADEHRSRFVR